ncbi:MAG: hypothetical protein AAF439_15970 [Pseudomonadota bacterium]
MTQHLHWKLGCVISLALLTLSCFLIVQSLSTIDATLAEGAPDPQTTDLFARFGAFLSLFG